MRLTPPALSTPALSLALSALLACACPLVLAAEPAPKARTTQEILDGSRPSDWRALDPARTLYMELASGRVIIELAPEFAPAHVANITTLAHQGYWDGLAIIRSQDNFVVQWGDPNADDAARKKPMIRKTVDATQGMATSQPVLPMS